MPHQLNLHPGSEPKSRSHGKKITILFFSVIVSVFIFATAGIFYYLRIIKPADSSNPFKGSVAKSVQGYRVAVPVEEKLYQKVRFNLEFSGELKNKNTSPSTGEPNSITVADAQGNSQRLFISSDTRYVSGDQSISLNEIFVGDMIEIKAEVFIGTYIYEELSKDIDTYTLTADEVRIKDSSTDTTASFNFSSGKFGEPDSIKAGIQTAEALRYLFVGFPVNCLRQMTLKTTVQGIPKDINYLNAEITLLSADNAERTFPLGKTLTSYILEGGVWKEVSTDYIRSYSFMEIEYKKPFNLGTNDQMISADSYSDIYLHRQLPASYSSNPAYSVERVPGYWPDPKDLLP